MAFNSTLPYVEYTINSGQTLFVYGFKVYFTGDVSVYLTQNGTQRKLLENADYTVSITGDNGGTTTLLTPANSGDLIVIRRELDLNRLVEYQTSGDLLAGTLNDDQDYQTYLIQDISADNNNFLSVPQGVPNFTGEFPAPGAGEFIKWNDQGTQLETEALEAGPKGETGDTGDTGAPGIPGPTGAQGNTGLSGPQGIQGLQGSQGDIGSTGEKGEQGEQGLQGTGVNVIGSDTVANIYLISGAAGDMWIATDSNPIGAGYVSDGLGSGSSHWTNVGQIQGPKGETGDQGAQGIQGVQGVQGSIGTTGAQGTQGIQGIPGDTGPQGPEGDTGPQGIAGDDAAIYSYNSSTETLTITLP